MDFIEEKKLLRRQMKMTFLRQSQAKDGLQKLSQELCDRILASPVFSQSPIILTYMPLPDEADVSPVTEAAQRLGKRIFIPRISSDHNSNQMDFFLYKSQDKTEKDIYGIEEPADTSKPFCEDDEVSKLGQNQKILILVPGRAFTKDGKRLGRGKGYYDYFLSHLAHRPSFTLAGVALPFQVVPELPTDKNDFLMDFVFTSAE